MTSDQFTIFVGDGAWHVAAVRDAQARLAPVAAADAALPARIGALREQLVAMGYADEPVVLALASSWCLCANLSTEGLERGQRRREMAFRLEEHLPVSAEDLVADFINTRDAQAMGVCCELARVEPLVAAMEAAKIAVRHICPAATLAAEHAVGQHAQLGAVLLGWQDNAAAAGATSYDVLEIEAGKLSRWWWLAGDGPAAGAHLAGVAATREQPVLLAVLGCDELPGQAGEYAGLRRVDLQPPEAAQAAACQAARILQQGTSPWVDLRRDKLAAPQKHQVCAKPMAALVIAAAALLVAVSGVMVWRGWQYGAMLDQSLQRQSRIFRAAMPAQTVPPNIKGRLQSEQRKLAGLAGASGSAGAAAATPSALVRLRDVLANLPGDLRYRILDLSIQPDLVRLEGQARSHVEAERLAASLRQSGLFDVEPPNTQAIRDAGVSFRFTAKPRASAATAEGHKP
jgi:hypothetical protein